MHLYNDLEFKYN